MSALFDDIIRHLNLPIIGMQHYENMLFYHQINQEYYLITEEYRGDHTCPVCYVLDSNGQIDHTAYNLIVIQFFTEGEYLKDNRFVRLS